MTGKIEGERLVGRRKKSWLGNIREWAGIARAEQLDIVCYPVANAFGAVSERRAGNGACVRFHCAAVALSDNRRLATLHAIAGRLITAIARVAQVTNCRGLSTIAMSSISPQIVLHSSTLKAAAFRDLGATSRFYTTRQDNGAAEEKGRDPSLSCPLKRPRAGPRRPVAIERR
ncbi:unnamed protein product, partial [Iphiclides podalirius]